MVIPAPPRNAKVTHIALQRQVQKLTFVAGLNSIATK
jgi:hypothetical protein